VKNGSELSETHANFEREYLAVKQKECEAFFTRICTELAESLPTGFKMELSQRVKKEIP